MKVKVDNGLYKNIEISLRLFVSNSLENSEASGQIEEMKYTIDNMLDAFGNLIETLADKNLLSETDVKNILNEHYIDITFIE